MLLTRVFTSCIAAVPFGNYWGIFSQGRRFLGEIAETLLAQRPFTSHPAMSFFTFPALRILPFLGLHAAACFFQVHVLNGQPAPSPSAQQVLTRVPTPVLNNVLHMK